MFYPIILAVDVLEEQSKLYSSFEKEALPHMDALYNFALRMTGNRDDAGDLLQETYLRAFRFYDKFETRTNCKAWLFRVMRNAYINISRKKSKEPQKLDFDEIEKFYKKIKSSTDSSQMEKEIFKILDDELSEVLSSLPEDFRIVVVLCDIENFSYEEIADFVDCPVGTVKLRLFRARKMLFTKLHKYSDKLGYIKKD